MIVCRLDLREADLAAKLEVGLMSMPRGTVLQRLADLGAVSVDSLLGREPALNR
jgi:hypothetical protein